MKPRSCEQSTENSAAVEGGKLSRRISSPGAQKISVNCYNKSQITDNVEGCISILLHLVMEHYVSICHA